MGRKGLLVAAALLLAAYFLYEPIVDRFFTDTTLTVDEAPLPPADEQGHIRLGTGQLDLTFSPYGARIVSARLRDFTSRTGFPVELVADLLKTRGGVRIEIPQAAEAVDDQPYRYEPEGDGLAFVQEAAGNLAIRKSYHPAGRYGVRVGIGITNAGDRRVELPQGYRIIPFFGMRGEDEEESGKLGVSWTADQKESVRREKSKEIRETISVQGPVAWIGIQNRYFTQIFVPPDQEFQASIHPLGERQVYPVLSSPPLSLDPGQTSENSFLLYLGPLREKDLASHGASLENIIDYGTFDFLGSGVLLLLKHIHRYVANYGLCLILLAFLLRLLLFPLTQYNLKSLREMPRILQAIYRIEEEEKEDPERIEQRVRPLRRKQVRSMIGSFLPLVIQIPIFLALYQVLKSSIDLRHAEFALWVSDLSSRDPLYVLPLLMGLSMILQQRLTASDPESSRTWILMPLGFALLFAFFPAGLVLFWTTDTLFSVGQLGWIAFHSEGR